MKTSKDGLHYPRGSVWMCVGGLPDKADPGVQGGPRPVLIISSDDGNTTSESVLVALITSKQSTFRVNVPVVLDQNVDTILCNQVHTVSKRNLDRYMYTLSNSKMLEVEQAILQAFGIGSQPIDLEALDTSISALLDRKTAEYAAIPQKIDDIVITIAEKVEELFNLTRRPVAAPISSADICAEVSIDSDVLEKPVAFVDPVSANTKKRFARPLGKSVALKPLPNTEDERSRLRKPSGFWSYETSAKYINEVDTLPMSQIIVQWDLKDAQHARKMYNLLKKKYEL